MAWQEPQRRDDEDAGSHGEPREPDGVDDGDRSIHRNLDNRRSTEPLRLHRRAWKRPDDDAGGSRTAIDATADG